MSGNRRSRVLQFSAAQIAAGCLAVAVSCAGMPTVSKAQTPADDVASQIRRQGYACDGSATARRDVKRSRRDSTVWILSCRNAVYRVRLDPDMAARVTKLK